MCRRRRLVFVFTAKVFLPPRGGLPLVQSRASIRGLHDSVDGVAVVSTKRRPCAGRSHGTFHGVVRRVAVLSTLRQQDGQLGVIDLSAGGDLGHDVFEITR